MFLLTTKRVMGGLLIWEPYHLFTRARVYDSSSSSEWANISSVVMENNMIKRESECIEMPLYAQCRQNNFLLAEN